MIACRSFAASRIKSHARKLEQEIDAEIQSHIEMRIEDNIAAGMSSGNGPPRCAPPLRQPHVDQRTGNRQMRSWSWRVLRSIFAMSCAICAARPAFALTAILTLALGVGANVVVFGVLNALLLRPLNVAGARQALSRSCKQPGDDADQSYPDYLDYRARNNTFQRHGRVPAQHAGLSVGGTAEKCWNYEVSGNYFDMLGVQPQVGRFFHPSDEHGPNSAPYIVFSDAFWRARFNADPQWSAPPWT